MTSGLVIPEGPPRLAQDGLYKLNLFARDAAEELHLLTSQWFASSASNSPRLGEHTEKLVHYVKEVGSRFGILGGAVAIVDRVTNRYVHLKHYPGDIDLNFPILPYDAPPEGQYVDRLEPIFAEHGKDAGIWINELFEIRRNQQRAKGDQARMPESERSNNSELIVLTDEIRKVIQEWVDVLALIGFLMTRFPHKEILTVRTADLEPLLPLDFFSSDEFRHFADNITLFDCLTKLLSSKENFAERWPHSVEAMFFHENSNGPSEVREILGECFSKLTLSEIYHVLSMPQRKERDRFFGEDTIPELLEKLHGESARFPVVEYLVLNLLWTWQYLCHIVWPFFKTLTYGVDSTSGRLSPPGLLLLTFRANGPERPEEIVTHLSLFFLLMKEAMEPFADRVFYSGIRAREGQDRQAAAVNQAISHEFKSIVPLISICPPWLNLHIQHWLLGFALPGLTRLDPAGDRDRIPEGLCGKDGQTYFEWIEGLSLLAAEIESMATPGQSLHVPSREAWQANVNRLAASFNIEIPPAMGGPPESFGERCMLGIAILCLFRNCIQHTTYYERDWDENGIGRYGNILLSVPESRITCRLSGSRDPVWGSNDLTVTNTCSGNHSKKTGGTAPAINFYLTQIADARKIPAYSFSLPEKPVNNEYVSTLPALICTPHQ